MKRRTKKLVAALMLILMLLNNSLNVYASVDSIDISEDTATSVQEDVSNETAAPVQEPSVPTEEPPAQEPQIAEEAPVGGEQATIQAEEVEPTSEVVAPETNTNDNNSEVVEQEPESVQEDITSETAQEDIIDEAINPTEEELEAETDAEEVEAEVDMAELMPVQDFKETVGDIHVSVHADEGTFYKDTYMKVEPVETSNIIDSLEETIEDSVASVIAVNITFYNENNEEVEPQKEVSVSITSDAITEMKESVVVHVEDSGDAAIVDKSSETDNNVSFDAKTFSIYAVVGTETISTLYDASNGNTYEVTITYGPNANIPYGSKLVVTEFAENSNDYNKALNSVYADKIAKGEKVDLSTFKLAALDISIIDKDGNEIEPEEEVSVNLKIKSLPGVDNLGEIKDSVEIQHHVETNGGVVVDHVSSSEIVNNNNLDSAFGVETNQNVLSNGTVVNPNSVNVEDVILEDISYSEETLNTSFNAPEFSTYTITWNSNRNRTTIHYGYMSNGSFVEISQNPTQTEINTSYNDYLIRDFDGYHYSGYSYYHTNTTSTPASGGTRIQAYLKYSSSNWRYHNYDTEEHSNGWNSMANGSHVYVIYEADSAVPNGGTPKVEITDSTVKPTDPTVLKESKSNDVNGKNDGTRTISLSITGKTTKLEADKLADVIVVFDVSGSMTSSMGNSNRLATAKSAVNSLANSLLSKTNSQGQKQIRMALISFSHEVKSVQGFTDNYTTFSNAVNGLSANGGTNWEGALQMANQMSVDPDRATFVIFVSDGDPTYRVSRYGASDREIDGYDRDNRYLALNIFGEGDDDTNNRNFDAAVVEAKSIVQHSKNFYTIAISSDVSKMAQLNSQAGGKGNFTANDQQGLKDAFDRIKEEIEGTLGFGANVQDGITGLTNLSAKTSIVGVDEDSFEYFKNGAPWDPTSEGAQEATYNPETGAVEWDLGTNFQLENDVTYKVSFLVWPSQQAIDYVTQLNNHDIVFSDLPADAQAQIEESPAGSGNYVLKTNTSDAHVSYQMCSKVGDTITPIGDVKKAYFNDVPPLNLDTMPFKVVKEFDDSLTGGSDRETEVHLLLERRAVGTEEWEFCAVPYTKPDGTSAHTSADEPYIVLSAGNEWKAEFYISPGLETVHGEDTVVYNQGYEYRLREPNIDYHYEIDSEIIKPMLVNMDRQYIGDTDGNEALTATNVVKGGINIYKKLYDKNNQEVTGDDTEFTIKGSLTDATGNPYTYQEGVDDINKTGAYHKYDANGNQIISKGHFASTANIEFTLKANEYVRFINVPKGSKFTFHEDTVPEGYEWLSIEGNNRQAEGNLPSNQQPTVSGNTISGDVYGNTEHNVIIKNKAVTGNLEISKSVEGKEDSQEEFTFKVTLSDRTINDTFSALKNGESTTITFSNGEATVTLKDGETYKISGIPDGLTYTVEETNIPGGYTADSQSKTGTITAGNTAQAAFVNTYSSSGSIDLVAKKELSGKTLANGQFTFTLKEGENEIQTKTNDADGNVIFDTISYTQADLSKSPITYKISEVVPENTAGYTYDTKEVTVTVTLVDDGAGHITATPAYSPEATFKNEYKASGNITFAGTKTLTGRAMTANDVFTFEILEGDKSIGTATNDQSGKISYPTINYTEKDVGEHTYTIKETSTSTSTVTVDSNTYTVTVTVTDNGDGTLTATSNDPITKLDFVNTYSSSGSVTLEVTKSLEGRTLEADQFTFELKDAEGNVLQTKKNAADGKVTFDTISYTQADMSKSPITYTISEKSEGKQGYTYDTVAATVTVTLSDDGNGTITASTEYSKTEFKNEYKASGNITFAGTKTLTGRTMTADDVFTFEILEGDKSIGTATNDPSGKISYPTINYTEKDVGEHTYTIKETSESTSTVTVDSNIYTVTVTVTDNGDGTLTATSNDPITKLDFVNTYSSSGSVTLEVTKILEGRTLEADQFTFELKDAEGNVLQTKKNAANGKVAFDTISYTQADMSKSPITYTISEKSEGKQGYTYDTVAATVTVTLSDDGNGTITASTEYSKTEFKNEYKASGNITFAGTKTLTGRDMTESDVFTFEILEGDKSIGTATNDQSGKISYPTINYTEKDVGEHTYTIKETSESTSTVTVDSNTYTVTVTVTDNGDGTLTATSNDPITKLDFVNTYSSSGSVTLSVDKTLSGRTLAANQFTFELKNAEGNVLQTKKNDANGKVTFDAISYTQDDMSKSPITYTISEVNDGNQGYTYDTVAATVTVTLSDDGNGTITASTEYSKNIFKNEYKATGSITFAGTKTLTGRAMTANDVFTFEILEGDKSIGTATNDQSGKISYPTINYTEKDVGEHTYTIKETSESTSTVTVDSNTYTVTVTVTDNGDGTLTATPNVSINNLDFVNTYSSSGSVTLEVTKTLEGRTLEADQFTFELKDAEGNVLQTKKNAANGKVTFDAIDYTQDDMSKSPITYTISEVNDGNQGYTYDTVAATVTVTLSDDGNGTITASTEYSKTEFKNEYKATGNVTFAGTKTLTGRAMTANDVFKFEILEDGVVIATAENDANGNIQYPTIEYVMNKDKNDVKDHEYTVRESSTDGDGITVATNSYTVTVKVEDNGDGTLKVTPSDNSKALDFVNTYEAKGNVTFAGKKTIDCRDLLEGETFKFEVKEGDTVIATVENDANGNIQYPTIDYVLNKDKNDLGEHTYTISETSTNGDGITVATNSYTVTVNVEDGGKGELIVTPGDNSKALDFVNTYEAKGDVTFTGKKTIDCRDLIDGETYKFEVKEGDTVVATVENDANGNIQYPTIKYVLNKDKNDLGEHTYTISETSTDGNGIKVATNTYTVTVNVEDGGKGELIVTPSDNSKALDFVNTYEAKGTVTFEGTKTLLGREMTSDDVFTFEIKEGDTVIATVENDEKGNIQYPTIEYVLNKDKSDLGEHTYIISETSTDGNGITVSKDTYTVTVNVEDGGKGELIVTPSENYQSLDFVNEYEAKGNVTFEGTKTIDGRDMTANDIYTFEIKEGDNVIATVENDAEGNIAYPTIEYVLNKDNDDLGEHTYTIKETSKGGYGIVVDTTEYTVTVKVEDNGNGELAVIPSDNYQELNFVNKYRVVNITVNKTWDDLDNKFGFRTDSITVRLMANGKEVKTAKIIGIGNDWKYTFSNLEEYSNGEKIKYTVTEDAVAYYTTTVVDNGDNTFKITNKIIPMGGSENDPPTQGTTIILQSANPATRSKDYTVFYDTMIAISVIAIAIVTKKERDRDKRIRILNSARIKFK